MGSDHMSSGGARSNTLFSWFACRIGIGPAGGPGGLYYWREGARLPLIAINTALGTAGAGPRIELLEDRSIVAEGCKYRACTAQLAEVGRFHLVKVAGLRPARGDPDRADDPGCIRGPRIRQCTDDHLDLARAVDCDLERIQIAGAGRRHITVGDDDPVVR